MGLQRTRSEVAAAKRADEGLRVEVVRHLMEARAELKTDQLWDTNMCGATRQARVMVLAARACSA